jgi:P4 family phage/plasmid primase-like protien
MEEIEEKKSWIVPVFDKTGETKKSKILPMELAQYIRNHMHYIFVRGQATEATLMYAYINGVYRLISDEELKGLIKEFIPYSIRKSKDINEVFFDLTTDNVFVDYEKLNEDENIINFQDGLLHLDNMQLYPHSPDVLTTIQIPVNYNDIINASPNAPNFDKYMATLCNGDEEIEELLLECLGLVISNIRGYRTKKALFLVGKGDTGKSQLKKLAEYLVGMTNVSNIDLEKINQDFGTAAVYQKRLVGCNDMSYQKIEDMSVFKQLTGGDSINITFKFKNSFPYLYKGFLWFNCNKLPRFGGDTGKWVYDRIMPVYCNNVIPKEKQDPHLFEKMLEEKETIIYKAIIALYKLISNGYKFTEPACIQESRNKYETTNNTLLTFIQECCFIDEDFKGRKLKRSEFNTAYSKWCNINNNGYGKLNSYDMENILEEKFGETYFKSCDGYWVMNKIHLSPESKELLGIYDTFY